MEQVTVSYFRVVHRISSSEVAAITVHLADDCSSMEVEGNNLLTSATLKIVTTDLETVRDEAIPLRFCDGKLLEIVSKYLN